MCHPAVDSKRVELVQHEALPSVYGRRQANKIGRTWRTALLMLSLIVQAHSAHAVFIGDPIDIQGTPLSPCEKHPQDCVPPQGIPGNNSGQTGTAGNAGAGGGGGSESAYRERLGDMACAELAAENDKMLSLYDEANSNIEKLQNSTNELNDAMRKNYDLISQHKDALNAANGQLASLRAARLATCGSNDGGNSRGHPIRSGNCRVPVASPEESAAAKAVVVETANIAKLNSVESALQASINTNASAISANRKAVAAAGRAAAFVQEAQRNKHCPR